MVFLETINDIMLPTIYISCILSVMLMVTSSTATWSVYKVYSLTLKLIEYCSLNTVFSFVSTP